MVPHAKTAFPLIFKVNSKESRQLPLVSYSYSFVCGALSLLQVASTMSKNPPRQPSDLESYFNDKLNSSQHHQYFSFPLLFCLTLHSVFNHSCQHTHNKAQPHFLFFFRNENDWWHWDNCATDVECKAGLWNLAATIKTGGAQQIEGASRNFTAISDSDGGYLLLTLTHDVVRLNRQTMMLLIAIWDSFSEANSKTQKRRHHMIFFYDRTGEW